MSRPEATAIDPQQRLLMERFAEALHESNVAGHALSASTGMPLNCSDLMALETWPSCNLFLAKCTHVDISCFSDSSHEQAW